MVIWNQDAGRRNLVRGTPGDHELSRRVRSGTEKMEPISTLAVYCRMTFQYEVIPAVSKDQFQIVSSDSLNREDVDTIYVCTDSGREGEYIYRLVDQMADVTEQRTNESVDRLPDRRGDPQRDPGGKRPDC